jgi:hypothetical protein
MGRLSRVFTLILVHSLQWTEGLKDLAVRREKAFLGTGKSIECKEELLRLLVLFPSNSMHTIVCK